MKSPTILFVGLGMMGYPMANRIASAGFPLWVADADSARAQQFAAEHPGVLAFVPGKETLPDIDVVITMLPNSAIVESVIVGHDDQPGLSAAMKRGAIVIDMSSSEPLRSRELAATLAETGLLFLDAPVSGGVKRASDGSLAIMAGGDKAVFEQCAEILQCMSKTLFHVGPAGAGHAVKALNNYVSAAGLAATVEALQAAEQFGLDPAIVTDVFNASTGRNNTTENKVKQFMLSGSFNSGFSLQLMTKDLGIAMKLGQDLGTPMPLGSQCLALWAEAAKQSGPATDHTEMYRLLGKK